MSSGRKKTRCSVSDRLQFRVTCARSLIRTPTLRQRVCYIVCYMAARFAIHIGNMLFDVGAPRELADFYGAPGVTFSLDPTFTRICVDTDSRIRVCFSARMCSQRAAAPRDCAGSRTDLNLEQRESWLFIPFSKFYESYEESSLERFLIIVRERLLRSTVFDEGIVFFFLHLLKKKFLILGSMPRDSLVFNREKERENFDMFESSLFSNSPNSWNFWFARCRLRLSKVPLISYPGTHSSISPQTTQAALNVRHTRNRILSKIVMHPYMRIRTRQDETDKQEE